MRWSKPLVAVLAVLTAAAMGSARGAYGQQQPQAVAPPPASPGAGAETEPSKADPFQVPDGTPEQLLEYALGLRSVRPESADPAALEDFRKRLFGAVLQSADKILAQQAPEQIALEAVQLKVAALVGLASSGDTQAAAALASLPADLEKAGKATLAARARTLLLMHQVQQAAFGRQENPPELVDQVAKHLAAVALGPAEVQLAMLTAQLYERTGQRQSALRAYSEFGKLLAASPDERIAELGQMMSGTARRLDLPGNALELEGTTVDGATFNWSHYKGKVVLVMFWATWCGPCRRELPVVLENYQAYHERGFDVVGISVDDDKASLDSFLGEQKLPWTVVFDKAAGKAGMALRYGVFAIPQTILVGRDGKVIATDVRGRELRSQLENLIGPAETPPSPSTSQGS